MEDSMIIDAADRFTKKKPLPPGADPLWTTTPDEARALLIPTVKTLPFVSKEWKNEYWPKSMWADVPTDDFRGDRARGRHFAKLTLGAIMADRPAHDRALAVIFEHMVEDAIKRRAKGGKGSRRLSGTVHGFLEVLAEFITAQCCGGGTVTAANDYTLAALQAMREAPDQPISAWIGVIDRAIQLAEGREP
jgi:hypothetical protein